MTEQIAFTAAAALDLVIKLEQAGATFYRKAAAAVQDEEIATTLLQLASEEDKHEEKYEHLKETYLATDGGGVDANSAVRGFVDIFMEDEIFDGDAFEKLTVSGLDIQEILRAATEAEYKTIALVSALREMIPAFADQKWVNAVIAEELTHIETLGRLQRSQRNAAANAALT